MNGRLWQRGGSLRSFNVVGVYTGYVSCRANDSSGSTADPLFRLTNQAAGGDVLVGRSFSKAPTKQLQLQLQPASFWSSVVGFIWFSYFSLLYYLERVEISGQHYRLAPYPVSMENNPADHDEVVSQFCAMTGIRPSEVSPLSCSQWMIGCI